MEIGDGGENEKGRGSFEASHGMARTRGDGQIRLTPGAARPMQPSMRSSEVRRGSGLHNNQLILYLYKLVLCRNQVDKPDSVSSLNRLPFNICPKCVRW